MTSLKLIKAQIQEAIQNSKRASESVRLIAVSKKQPPEKIKSFWQAGQVDFGENYVQEWQSKVKVLTEDPVINIRTLRWHFIGHLQSNKIKEVVGKVEYIHSVDQIKLAEKVSAFAQRQNIIQKILLEINLGHESSKSGFSEIELIKSLPHLAKLPHLSLVGLMAIPPAHEDPEFTRPYFKRLKSLREECNQKRMLSQEMTELSMGMSHDFKVAIQEGATMIRLGTILFGQRS